MSAQSASLKQLEKCNIWETFFHWLAEIAAAGAAFQAVRCSPAFTLAAAFVKNLRLSVSIKLELVWDRIRVEKSFFP
jgi:hypothetical protein